MRRVSVVTYICLALFTPLVALADDEQLVDPANGATERASAPPAAFWDREIRVTPPSAAMPGYGLFTTGAEPGDIDGYVGTATRTVHLRNHGATIFTDDGFWLTMRALRNDPDVVMILLTARDPVARRHKRTSLV